MNKQKTRPKRTTLANQKLSTARVQRVVRTLQRALRRAAEEIYVNDVLDTEMEQHIIGDGLEYARKQDWIEAKIDDWMSS